MGKRQATDALTLKYYEDQGWTIDKVEMIYQIPGPKPKTFRRDWCGFADYIAFKGNDLIAIQACKNKDLKEHYRKVKAEPRAHDFAAGACRKLHIISWDVEVKPPKPVVVEIGLADFVPSR